MSPASSSSYRSIVSGVARRFRRRADLEPENLALRHQLHVLRRQRTGRVQLFAIGLALPDMAELSGHNGVGQAGHRRPMAPPGLSPVLALAFEIGTAVSQSRDSQTVLEGPDR